MRSIEEQEAAVMGYMQLFREITLKSGVWHGPFISTPTFQQFCDWFFGE